jgi:hypothetical protein
MDAQVPGQATGRAGQGRTMNGESQMNRLREFFCFVLFCFLRHKDNATTHEAIVDHLTRFYLSSREEISQSGIEPPTSSLSFGYLSTIIQYVWGHLRR